MIFSTSNYTTENQRLHFFPSQESEPSFEELSKVIHTAFVSAHADENSPANFDSIEALMQTPAFETIMNATLQLSKKEKISELEAAKKIIQMIRNLDQIWKSLLIKEGLKTLSS